MTAARSVSYRVSAFGLDVEAPWRLPGATEARSAGPGPGRDLRVTWAAPERLQDTAWEGAPCVYEPPFTDGQSHFTVRRGAAGYRLSFDDFGRYAVSLDGRQAACEADAVTLERSERFLFAQVLPLAAVLQGLDVIHAGAVAWDGGVVALVGPSGAGKTTLATRLVARGATFVTDDALALEMNEEGVVAHPGPPFVAIAAGDAALAGGALAWLGPQRGASDKPHFVAPVCQRPLPLTAVYYLTPRAEFDVTAASGEVVPRLLAHAAAPYVLSPERLLEHLEVVTTVTTSVPQFSLTLAEGEPSEHDLGAFERHMRGVGS
jgi:AAA domain-containing protein